MSALPTEDLQPYDGQRLDDACGDNFTAEHVGDGFLIDCSGCGIFWVPEVEAAIASIDHHRTKHDQESREMGI